MLLAGGLAMASRGSGTLLMAVSSVALLFVVAVVLHARMYALRPDPSRLTLFYLAMSLGGALGGVFTALVAPLVFDWVWEHPLLILAAALLMPLPRLYDWRRMPGLSPVLINVGVAVVLIFALFMAMELFPLVLFNTPGTKRTLLTLGIAVIGLAMEAPWRRALCAGAARLDAGAGPSLIGSSPPGTDCARAAISAFTRSAITSSRHCAR